ncbi:hypothetical protein H072_10031 [Dactylellina haptotyla CBS 200.50]|uniref:Uncharacterized protein n=1 Tax=Dactylellina haptotyla (strain CBS 200.50) TaxID=1284197 RepID=S8BML5_DACHA|nr:hypothetical protein H072_10031 [Dactylellina haptotyla CBS 200.50]
MPPDTSAVTRSTARGFQILVLPSKGPLSSASGQQFIQGDTSSDYGPRCIFLTLELSHKQDQPALCSLSITYPIANSRINRLKYDDPENVKIFYKIGINAHDADMLWIISRCLPKVDHRSSTKNTPWKNIQLEVENSVNLDTRHAFYLRTIQGRKISAEFLANCTLGRIKSFDIATPANYDKLEEYAKEAFLISLPQALTCKSNDEFLVALKAAHRLSGEPKPELASSARDLGESDTDRYSTDSVGSNFGLEVSDSSNAGETWKPGTQIQQNNTDLQLPERYERNQQITGVLLGGEAAEFPGIGVFAERS